MRPKTFGRAVGIGARLAGDAVLGAKPPETAAQAAERIEAEREAQRRAVANAGARGRAAGTVLGEHTRDLGTKLGHGSRNFGRAVWNPFAHATGVLWLEITGSFFALFAFFFAQHLYTLRAAWRGGAEHQRLLLYAALTLLFAYFSASSFVKARRKQRRARS